MMFKDYCGENCTKKEAVRSSVLSFEDTVITPYGQRFSKEERAENKALSKQLETVFKTANNGDELDRMVNELNRLINPTLQKLTIDRPAQIAIIKQFIERKSNG